MMQTSGILVQMQEQAGSLDLIPFGRQSEVCVWSEYTHIFMWSGAHLNKRLLDFPQYWYSSPFNVLKSSCVYGTQEQFHVFQPSLRSGGTIFAHVIKLNKL